MRTDERAVEGSVQGRTDQELGSERKRSDVRWWVWKVRTGHGREGDLASSAVSSTSNGLRRPPPRVQMGRSSCTRQILYLIY